MPRIATTPPPTVDQHQPTVEKMAQPSAQRDEEIPLAALLRATTVTPLELPLAQPMRAESTIPETPTAPQDTGSSTTRSEEVAAAAAATTQAYEVQLENLADMVSRGCSCPHCTNQVARIKHDERSFYCSPECYQKAMSEMLDEDVLQLGAKGGRRRKRDLSARDRYRVGARKQRQRRKQRQQTPTQVLTVEPDDEEFQSAVIKMANVQHAANDFSIPDTDEDARMPESAMLNADPADVSVINSIVETVQKLIAESKAMDAVNALIKFFTESETAKRISSFVSMTASAARGILSMLTKPFSMVARIANAIMAYSTQTVSYVVGKIVAVLSRSAGIMVKCMYTGIVFVANTMTNVLVTVNDHPAGAMTSAVSTLLSKARDSIERSCTVCVLLAAHAPRFYDVVAGLSDAEKGVGTETPLKNVLAMLTAFANRTILDGIEQFSSIISGVAGLVVDSLPAAVVTVFNTVGRYFGNLSDAAVAFVADMAARLVSHCRYSADILLSTIDIIAKVAVGVFPTVGMAINAIAPASKMIQEETLNFAETVIRKQKISLPPQSQQEKPTLEGAIAAMQSVSAPALDYMHKDLARRRSEAEGDAEEIAAIDKCKAILDSATIVPDKEAFMADLARTGITARFAGVADFMNTINGAADAMLMIERPAFRPTKTVTAAKISEILWPIARLMCAAYTPADGRSEAPSFILENKATQNMVWSTLRMVEAADMIARMDSHGPAVQQMGVEAKAKAKDKGGSKASATYGVREIDAKMAQKMSSSDIVSAITSIATSQGVSMEGIDVLDELYKFSAGECTRDDLTSLAGVWIISRSTGSDHPLIAEVRRRARSMLRRMDMLASLKLSFRTFLATAFTMYPIFLRSYTLSPPTTGFEHCNEGDVLGALQCTPSSRVAIFSWMSRDPSDFVETIGYGIWAALSTVVSTRVFASEKTKTRDYIVTGITSVAAMVPFYMFMYHDISEFELLLYGATSTICIFARMFDVEIKKFIKENWKTILYLSVRFIMDITLKGIDYAKNHPVQAAALAAGTVAAVDILPGFIMNHTRRTVPLRRREDDDDVPEST